MQPAASQGDAGSTGRNLRKWGPLAAIVAVAAVVIVVVVAGGGDDAAAPADSTPTETAAPPTGDSTPDTDPAPTATDAPPDTTDPDGTTAPDPDDPFAGSPLPPGVMSFSVAQDLGLDLDFGARCDPATGNVAVPDFFAPECYLPFSGDNGGATARGVTADTIRIVYWIAQDQDPVLGYITSAILNDDTNADEIDTVQKMIEYYETYYETYGRSVELIVVEGSGTITDSAAARADAVKIDEELDPFMVWGGPALTSAFAEELAARGIPCISCGPPQAPEFYTANPGMNYSLGKSGQQLDLLVAEYIGKKLVGDPAIHAGDEAMHGLERVFGRIWIESSAASAEANERFETDLAEYGVEIAESQSYVLDPATLQESASSVIARMKEAGVTSVIFNGDPIAPREFTREATAQAYFPEWIVTGSVLVDTAAFSRTYDQAQWANAFGISNLAARVDRTIGGSFPLYTWFHGEEPRADDTIDVLTPTPGLFYAVLQAVGPELTIENFNTALFEGPPTRRAITAPTLSYGTKGIWPERLEPDYFGVDDIAEVWWDPTAPGPDEIDKDGVGLWRFVDGGTRYLPGELPEGAPAAFVLDGTVTIYTERPPSETTGTYTPLRP